MLSNHIHRVVLPTLRPALHTAMRSLFSTVARAINARLGRKGTVFPERSASGSAVDRFKAVAGVYLVGLRLVKMA
jgi:hypothetical protein